MKLIESSINLIDYTSDSTNETTKRVIIPMHVPFDNVRAIDVSLLEAAEQQTMVEMVVEYKQYIASVMATAYKFEDWAEHTKNVSVQPKWRTFKLANVQVNG